MNHRSRTAGAIGLLIVAACGSTGTASPVPATSTTAPEPPATALAPSPAAPSVGPTGPGDVMQWIPSTSLAPGTWFIEPPGISARIDFTVPTDEWLSWIGTYRNESQGPTQYRKVGLSVANVINLVTHGCTDHSAQDPVVGPTVNDLATALASLEPFVVREEPEPASMAGYEGTHMAIEVPEIEFRRAGTDTFEHFPECTNEMLNSWIAPPLSYAFYGYTAPAQVEEFWILDVEGKRLVIEANWFPDSPEKDVAELKEIIESIEITPD
jgi:hypothetical protein